MAGRGHLIAYDISRAAMRRKAFTLLRAYSISYQDSLFEIEETDILVNELCHNLTEATLEESDLLLSLRIDRGRCWQLGTGLTVPTNNFLVFS